MVASREESIQKLPQFGGSSTRPRFISHHHLATPKDNKHHRARKVEHRRIADAEAERRQRKRCGSASPCATASRRRASSRRGLQRASVLFVPRVASRNSCKIGSAHFAINIKRTDEPKPSAFAEGHRVALEQRGRGRRAVSEAWAI